MWCYIHEKDIQKYLENFNQEFITMFSDLILKEIDGCYFLPRHFLKNYPSHLLKEKNILLPYNTINEDIKFTKKLWNEQKNIVDIILKKYKENNNKINGIIKARPGIGKTIISLYIAIQIGLKTLIIVDNNYLLKQWVIAIHNFTNIKNNDIGLIYQNCFSVDKSICIAMVQSLYSKFKINFKNFFKKIDNANFGLVIYDEVHKGSAAPKYSKVSLLFRTENILGLSATPFHTGVHKILMENTIGKILVESNNYELKPIYTFVYYSSDLPKTIVNKTIFLKELYHKRAIYNKEIPKSLKYCDLIYKMTKYLLSINHKILLIFFTKNQVKTISDYLTNKKIKNRRFYGDENKIDKKNDNVLVATYKYAGAAFDFQELSSLIIACPLSGKKSIIQVVGRILREFKGKQQPIVFDMIDLTFPHLFIKDISIKRNIITNEFKCEIKSFKI